MNLWTLIGRITRDPEARVTNSGMQIIKFGVAVQRKRDRDKSDFFDCTAFGKTAEFIEKYFTKGKPILLVGEAQLEQWESDGQKRSKVSMAVNEASFVPFVPADKSAPPPETQLTDMPNDNLDEEIPF